MRSIPTYKQPKYTDRPTETIKKVYAIRDAIADKHYEGHNGTTFCDRRTYDYRVKIVCGASFAKRVKKAINAKLPDLHVSLGKEWMGATSVKVIVPLLGLEPPKTKAKPEPKARPVITIAILTGSLHVHAGRGAAAFVSRFVKGHWSLGDGDYDTNGKTTYIIKFPPTSIGANDFIKALVCDAYERFDVHINHVG